MKNHNISDLTFTKEYKDKLTKLSLLIKRASETAENEATVVSLFEINLYSFINSQLGLSFFPVKEKRVNTERHIAQGRIDSKYGAFVIEFKHKDKLRTPSQKAKATKQIIDYLKGLNESNKTDYLGLITDGIFCKYIRCEEGKIYEEGWGKISTYYLDRAIKSIVLLEQVALTSENLVRDFCEPLDDNLSKQLTKVFYETLKKDITPKTKMLFEEWKELFKLSHDDKSKQRDIQDRREELSQAIDVKITTNDEEYLALYSLQTTYALIIKLIAFKVISKFHFNEEAVEIGKLAEYSSSKLQLTLESLEDGEIFRLSGINNLLEGDFFSWYSTKQQWSERVYNKIIEIILILSKYEDKVLVYEQTKTYDLFKELYQKIIPSKVRHSLGEFYTPSWLADNVISECLALTSLTKEWKMLDPTSGSGTFLIVGIQKILEETEGLQKNSRLTKILNRIKGLDLNPLSVLTARINYFINIAHLIDEETHLQIPVYLGDSSYTPESIDIEDVPCLSYKIKTLKGYIDVVLPRSVVEKNEQFSEVMTEVEYDIKSLDWKKVASRIKALANKKDLTQKVSEKIDYLSQKFVELEKNEWNGIWARIVTNFLITASLGKFELIVGNPPWVDWKNLPEGYRERIKSLCISRDLFSGDRLTGGINLNICALIANVAADNWLHNRGVLGFLMPQNLLLLQTYEGFRNFKISDNQRLYFQKINDWTNAGHPFKPVQHKFLGYFISFDTLDYGKGVPTIIYNKKAGINIEKINSNKRFEDVRDSFTTTDKVVGQCIKGSTIFSYADSREELKKFKTISGVSHYIGREGIEFYPQELFLMERAAKENSNPHQLYLKNFQNDRSKYRIPSQLILLETRYLYPLVKGINIERFHISDSPQFIVPFPYEKTYSTRVAVTLDTLRKKSPLLAKYLYRYKDIISEQTFYNEKIIGKREKEFYSLARVGAYSFAKHYVAFRDNTKWQAAVVGAVNTSWGEIKVPVFQNHAVSMCERESGGFINENEAHFICAILNSSIVQKFILNSSDSRTFKIRPPVFIPLFLPKDSLHNKLSKLSQKAHKNYNNKLEMKKIDTEIEKTYLKLASRDNE